jgi:hypothetical protein
MQGPVNNHVGPVIAPRLSLLLRLSGDDCGTDHDIPEQLLRFVRQSGEIACRE